MTTHKDSVQVTRVQLSSLQIGKRHRAVNKHKVEALAESMKAIGLQHPISVYADFLDGDVHLVAGHHRVKAAMSLGWGSIPCIFVELDEIDREIWEIDENLKRAGLSKAEELEHFRRRKQLWRKRQSAHHAPIESKRADGKGHRPKGFAAETAAATGLSKSQVNRKLAGPKPKKAKPKGVAEPAPLELDNMPSAGELDRRAAAPSPAKPEANLPAKGLALFGKMNSAEVEAFEGLVRTRHGWWVDKIREQRVESMTPADRTAMVTAAIDAGDEAEAAVVIKHLWGFYPHLFVADGERLKPKNKKLCSKCHGLGTITSTKTGTTVDCDCVRNAGAAASH